MTHTCSMLLVVVCHNSCSVGFLPLPRSSESGFQEPSPKLCQNISHFIPGKRNLSVSSSSHDRQTETQHLTKVFMSNHYPSTIVRQVSRKCTHQYDLPEREKPIASICIPYIQGTSEHIRRILTGYNTRTSFWVKNTISKHICRQKDIIPPLFRSSVIYSVPCTNCHYT